MTHELASGYFVWNVLSWLFIFVVTAAVLCLAVFLSVRLRNGRIAHVHAASESRGLQTWTLEDRLAQFRETCLLPWLSSSWSHVLMLAVLAALLAAALLGGGGR